MSGTSLWNEIAPDGIFPIPGGNAVFLEPCRMISSSYSHHFALPSLYYCRPFFLSSSKGPLCSEQTDDDNKTKKKQKQKKRKRNDFSLNPKEQLVQQRHQEIRKFILDAYRAFVVLPEVSSLLRGIEDLVFECKKNGVIQNSNQEVDEKCKIEPIDFVKLATVWQAPLYEITLSSTNRHNNAFEGPLHEKRDHLSTFPLFKHMVQNHHNEELVGTCDGTTIILPKESRFLISDFVDIRKLIPCQKGHGYNLLLIDPPWENKSVHRHDLYPTLPNKYLLSLPLKELAHPNGALVGLWVTNREKLRAFVEDELFPAWGIINSATWYWLKIKSNGEMVTELDLLHHKPYECLLLGFMPPQATNTDLQIPAPKAPPNKRVLISIPGDHSRKPPLALLLSAYVPGQAHVQGLELFARDISPGWTSWGNEPIRFQQVQYFGKKT